MLTPLVSHKHTAWKSERSVPQRPWNREVWGDTSLRLWRPRCLLLALKPDSLITEEASEADLSCCYRW